MYEGHRPISKQKDNHLLEIYRGSYKLTELYKVTHFFVGRDFAVVFVCQLMSTDYILDVICVNRATMGSEIYTSILFNINSILNDSPKGSRFDSLPIPYVDEYMYELAWMIYYTIYTHAVVYVLSLINYAMRAKSHQIC